MIGVVCGCWRARQVSNREGMLLAAVSNAGCCRQRFRVRLTSHPSGVSSAFQHSDLCPRPHRPLNPFTPSAPPAQEEAAEIIEAFRPFFESAAHCKVWHNYSFDRHVLERLGYSMAGFAADTMHMARLWDSSRVGAKGGYSLETLSGGALGGGAFVGGW